MTTIHAVRISKQGTTWEAYRGPIETCNYVAETWLTNRPDMAVCITIGTSR